MLSSFGGDFRLGFEGSIVVDSTTRLLLAINEPGPGDCLDTRPIADVLVLIYDCFGCWNFATLTVLVIAVGVCLASEAG